MLIQVNTDAHIDADAALTEDVEETIRSALGRFEPRITRIEVHFQDVNADKGGRESAAASRDRS